MNVTLWGTRGSVPSPGPDTAKYGGNTSCVAVEARDGAMLVLDAGTGIRGLGVRLASHTGRLDVVLSHLHLDHIQGLGFFGPLHNPAVEVHLWGPASAAHSLAARLGRYLSPPLFPVRLRDLPRVQLHEVPHGRFEVGPFRLEAALVCHQNPTVGYRVEADGGALAYLPDHEPMLGRRAYVAGEWTSGYGLAAGVDLLIHDAQYTDEEYAARVGWGHSSLRQAIGFAELAGVRRFMPFHHDPSHRDEDLDGLFGAVGAAGLPFDLVPAREGMTADIGGDAPRQMEMATVA